MLFYANSMFDNEKKSWKRFINSDTYFVVLQEAITTGSTVTLTVKDINDNTPQFLSVPYSAQIPEVSYTNNKSNKWNNW